MTDWFSYIESYLDNELDSDKRLLFEQELNKNEDLKYEFLLHKLMLEGINKSGELDLKKYLKENTKVAKKTSLKWVWIASAACLVIGLVLYANFKNTFFQKPSHFTFEDTTKEVKNDVKNLENKEEVPLIAKNEIKTPNDKLLETDVSEIDNYDNFDDLNKPDFSNTRLIANVTMVPIQIGQLSENKKSIETTTFKRKTKEDLQETEFKKDSSPITIKNTYTNYDAVSSFEIPTFNVTFMQTDTISVLMRNNGFENGQYNLVVENALPSESEVLQYNNTYYLRTGNTYFLIDTAKNTRGKKVIDASLINKLKNAN